ncbi:MAG: DNA translocase FtsK 4TM domain-containing protein, partial [Desulfobacteraceae bacterium]|nr:DNA translocase FtsK 4TM domain-containing protein [Desulfobacteraceae bacterium]
MRKELVSIILIFIIIFSLGSLVSYSPDDPSIHHAGYTGEIENFFGFFGAHLSGFLIGLFGLGAFLIPILFFIGFLEFFKNRSGQALSVIASGGIILTVSFGSLLSFFQDTYILFGNDYSAGGMLGLPIKSFLLKYSNWTGGMVILSFSLLIGFILSTGISVVATIRNLGKLSFVAGNRVKNTYSHVLENRKNKKIELKLVKEKKEIIPTDKSENKIKKIALPFKRKKSEEIKKVNEAYEEHDILIKETLPPKPLRSVPVPKQQVFESMRFDNRINLPTVDFLNDAVVIIDAVYHENLKFLS